MMILPLWKKAKLQYKIMISVVPAVILLLLIVMVSYSSGKKNAITYSEATLALIKRQANSSINRILEQKFNQFRNWTEEDVYGLSIEFETLGELEQTITKMAHSDSGFIALLLVDKSGKVLLSSFNKDLDTDLKGARIEVPQSAFEQMPHSFFYSGKSLISMLNLDFASAAVFAFPSHATTEEVNGAFLAVLDWRLIQNEIMSNYVTLKDNGFVDASVSLVNSKTWDCLAQAGNESLNRDFLKSSEIKDWVGENDFGSIVGFSLNGAAVFTSARAFDNHSGLEFETNLILLNFIPEDNVLADVKSLLFTSIILAGVGICILFALTFVIAVFISRPIVELKNAAKKVTAGDNTVSVQLNVEDEIGQLGEAFNLMVEAISSSMDEAEKQNQAASDAAQKAKKAQEISIKQQRDLTQNVEFLLNEMEKFANGDLTLNITRKNDDAIGKLFDGFNRSVARIKTMLLQVQQTVLKTARLNDSVSSQTQQINDGAIRQLNQAMEAASAVEEMSLTSDENAKNASAAAMAAGTSGDKAREGGEIVIETIKGMNKITEVVNHTSSVVQ